MYVVAIGWLWVVLMMALTESSLTAGLLTFFFYGLAPLALFLWLAGTPQRRRAAARKRAASSDRQALDQSVRKAHGGDAGADQ
ncbi:MAG TPA: hypothetical protein PKC23_09445 [Candidatus Desulfobacillus sp.]|nr:hypothetical protein [Candidatus Desulfobacillus sp.]